MALPAARVTRRERKFAFKHCWTSQRYMRSLPPNYAESATTEVILPSQKEIDRRYKNIRSRMHATGLDALIVCGNQYAGFEGAVFYTSGFEIVHRYVYVVIPLE